MDLNKKIINNWLTRLFRSHKNKWNIDNLKFCWRFKIWKWIIYKNFNGEIEKLIDTLGVTYILNCLEILIIDGIIRTF